MSSIAFYGQHPSTSSTPSTRPKMSERRASGSAPQRNTRQPLRRATSSYAQAPPAESNHGSTPALSRDQFSFQFPPPLFPSSQPTTSNRPSTAGDQQQQPPPPQSTPITIGTSSRAHHRQALSRTQSYTPVGAVPPPSATTPFPVAPPSMARHGSSTIPISETELESFLMSRQSSMSDMAVDDVFSRAGTTDGTPDSIRTNEKRESSGFMKKVMSWGEKRKTPPLEGDEMEGLTGAGYAKTPSEHDPNSIVRKRKSRRELVRGDQRAADGSPSERRRKSAVGLQ